MPEKILLTNKKAVSLATDVLVVVVPSEPLTDPTLLELDEALGGALLRHLKTAPRKLEPGATIHVPTLGALPAAHLIVAVEGAASEPESAGARITEVTARGVREALSQEPKQIAVSLPAGAYVRAAVLGAQLGGYRFERYRSKKAPAKTISLLLGRNVTAADRNSLKKASQIAGGVCLARDLVNEPPNVLYPETFAKEAVRVAKTHKLKCKILDARGIERENMALHAAVGRGSSHPPTFIHLTYTPKNSRGSIAFVGKGLTFDSGGLCIKPMPGMADMKSDMAGGAAVLGLMEAVAAAEPGVTVHGIIGCAENMPDGNAYRPADVITSLSGKTVEIINTDAEGRLVLADALTYASRLKPDFLVDAATLTGATLVSLGSPYSAYFTSQDELAEAMKTSALRAGESFWRMPLVEELRAQLSSDIADLKHTGDRFGGAISAALFLREFTGGLPWMHCDIPGAVLRDRASGMHPKGGTGHAVLTFLELACRHGRASIVAAKPGPQRARTSSASSRRAVRAPARTAKNPAPRRRKSGR